MKKRVIHTAVAGFLTGMHLKKVWTVAPAFEIDLSDRKGMPIKGNNIATVAPVL